MQNIFQNDIKNAIYQFWQTKKNQLPFCGLTKRKISEM